MRAHADMKRWGLVVLSIMPWATASAEGPSCGAPVFSAPQMPIGAYAGSPVIADFDGDGDLDMAVPVPSDHGTKILLNDGDGNFEVMQLLPGAFEPTAPAVGDLDLDGDLDIAVANLNSSGVFPSLRVYRNNGQGSFTLIGSYLTPETTGARIADIAGSSLPDIVVSRSPLGIVYVLTNLGDGIMGAPAQHIVSGQTSEISEAADLDGDGDRDFAVGTGASVRMLRNDGGTLTLTTLATIASTVVRVATVDLDGDDDSDIVATLSNPGRLVTLANDGKGGFSPASDIAFSDNVALTTLTDFDGDGDPDVVLRMADASVQKLENQGKGLLAVVEPAEVILAQIYGIGAGDLNGDGHEDLALANGAGFALVSLVNDGSGHYPHATFYPGREDYDHGSLVMEDFNGDGIRDALVRYVIGPIFPQPGGLSLRLGAADGTFGPAMDHPMPYHPTAVAALDFDGDRDWDVLVAVVVPGYLNQFMVLRNDGEGSFSTLTTLQPPAFLGFVEQLDTSDLDGDGDIDAAAGTVDQVLLLLNDRGRGLTLSTLPMPVQVRHVTVDDFDGDQWPDLIVSMGEGSFTSGTHVIWVLLNDQRGGFRMAFEAPGVYKPGKTVLGDLNGDDLTDMVMGSAGTFGTYFYFNNGRGSLEAPVTYPGVDWYDTEMSLSDVDQDGDLDLLAGVDGVAVVLNNGRGIFQLGGVYSAVDNATSQPECYDVDDDGDRDVVVQTYTGLTVLPNLACEGMGGDPANLNGDGDVDGFDLALLLGAWTGAASYSPCPPHVAADLNSDCKVNGFDLALLLGAWG